MTNEAISIPFFPLPVAVLPGSETSLHIFEARYRLLINECLEKHTFFGIPYVKGSKVCSSGTQVRVTKLQKKYSDGRMDISIQGVATFRVEGLMASETPDVYGTGLVTFPGIDNDPVSHHVLDKFFSNSLELTGKVLDPDSYMGANIFQLATKLPLNNEQKFSLIEGNTLQEREEKLIRFIDLLLLLTRQESKIKGAIFPN